MKATSRLATVVAEEKPGAGAYAYPEPSTETAQSRAGTPTDEAPHAIRLILRIQPDTGKDR